MSSCTCSLHPSQQVNPGQQHPLRSELAKEMGESQRSSLSLLVTLLTILALPGSKLLRSAVLALLIYTVSIHLADNVCFLQTHPALSRFLHALPLLATFLMAAVELVLGMQSPAIALLVLLLSVLPLITAIIHRGMRCLKPAVTVLPVRIRDPPTTMSSSTDMTIALHSINSASEAGGCDIC